MLTSFLLTFSGVFALLAIYSVVFSSISLILKLTCLIITFFFIASQYILLDMNFLGLAFVIVYVGAISILFLFVIMMTDNGISPKFSLPYSNSTLFISFFISLPILYFLVDFSIIQLFQIYIHNFTDHFLEIDSIALFGRLTFLVFPFINILFGMLLWCILVGILKITGLWFISL